ncbi:MAG TPA: amidase family protein [Candidatus Thermoplasmatota archaeon]|nr:amidase family protein [Candidatus Thermoplasmatota archaeon]
MSGAFERARERLGADPWRAFLHVEGDAPRARDGPLSGMVASLKDNLAWKGRPMTCGSRHLERYHSPYTATVVERLEAAGATILGKTNMDEFAAGSSGENSAFGPTLNPRDLARVPGGSSSGAGASVAAGVVDVAIGSDTGGSARCPAAFCGIAALKPSHGLVSRHGMADLAMSLESPAPLARDVAGVEALLRAIAGPDPRDTVCTREIAPATSTSANELAIGVPREFFEGLAPDVEAPVRAALRTLEHRGAALVDVELPSVPHALAAYYVLNYAEFASAMARLDGFRYGSPGSAASAAESQSHARASFGAEVKRRILLGTFVTSREERGAWYDAALRARAQLAREFEAALAGCDVLMGPTMPMRAFKIGARTGDPREMYAADVLTVSANLARVPAGSVPLRVDGLPVGMQVIGRDGDDARVLAAMRVVEAL